tara:strand:- start:241 stop:498 length:258 start_codon:yes stop_codon:yes gene_type:complete
MKLLSELNFIKHINVPVFLVSLAIGLFLVYITVPTPRIIYVYPTPDNIEQIQYKDYTDNCFTFESELVECPENKDEITDIPVQHS